MIVVLLTFKLQDQPLKLILKSNKKKMLGQKGKSYLT